MTGAIFRLLKKHPAGIEIAQLPSLLEGAGVKNFRAELVGYETVEKFLQKESGQYFKFAGTTIKPR